jgi:hypothetical protein
MHRPGGEGIAMNRRVGARGSALSLSIRMLVAAATLCVVIGAPLAGATHVSGLADNDRSIKLDLISRLKAAPQTVVLGSSRAKRAEPTYLRELTGHTGFNAAVIGGTAADAWVMTRYVADCFPLEGRRYVWFVDVGIATNGVNPDLRADPRSGTYLGPAPRANTSHAGACSAVNTGVTNRYNADGSFRAGTAKKLPEHGSDLQAKAAKLVASVMAHPAALSGKLDPKRYVWFERALAYMNSHGSRPVIVLNPIYPSVLAALHKVGFPARQTSRAYLTQLHKRFDFVVVDGEDIHRWGGSPREFSDPTHINEVNMRLLLRYVVAHSDGAL